MRTNDDRLVQYMRTRLHLTDKQVVRNLARRGVTLAQVAAARAAAEADGPSGKPRAVSALLEQFDDIAKVRRAMKGLPRDHYVEDDEMRHNLHIPGARWRDVRAHKSLAAYHYKLPNGRYVWIHPEAQARLASAISLSGG